MVDGGNVVASREAVAVEGIIRSCTSMFEQESSNDDCFEKESSHDFA
jgi:hypothetical protein